MERYSIVIIYFCLFQLVFGNDSVEEPKCQLAHNSGNKLFPANFSFAVSTAAYQIEGAWNEDGKAPSIWDIYTHEHPEMIADKSNGDVGADSYHRFEQDLAALKELKVQRYRFSISWARILPKADIAAVNQKAVDYYNKVIDELISNGIEPMITMFHYDLPQELMNFGGFTNEIFIHYFRFYAETLFQRFGDRVKWWITFNEPHDYCLPGYAKASYPPMIHAPGVADYLCMEMTLKAHAAAYRLYQRKYFRDQGGKVGITLSSRFFFSKDGKDDRELVDRALHYSLGWLAHPIYSESGNYPYAVIEDVASNSVKEGRPWTRLRPLKQLWLDLIKGSADFLGLNYYTSRYVEAAAPPHGEVPSWEYDSRLKFTFDSKWKRAKSDWLYCMPLGLEGLLNWIKDNYNNIEVIITENGWSDDGQLQDSERIDYLKAHLQAVLNAINTGCNVTGYTHWSLIDNFEWQKGYTEKFGLYYVNMTSAEKERIPKDSARYYRKVIESRSIPPEVRSEFEGNE